MNKGNAWIWLLVLLLVAGGLATVFSIPVYKQNRYTALKMETRDLEDSLQLVRENLREIQVDLNQLNSREYIGAFAEEVLHLELCTAPKIVEVPSESK